MPKRRSVVHAFYIFMVSTFLAFFPSVALAGQVNLTWDLNTEPDIKSYNLYFGTQPGTYDAPGSPILIQHPQNLITVTGLQGGLEYFFALTAIDQSNNESSPSAENSTVIAEAPLPSDTTPPTISLTAPADGATLSDIVIVSASASDDIDVVGVQFQLDGVNLGTEDLTNAYSVSWDTSTILSGSHSLTAIARDAAGNTATSTPVVVSIDNGGSNNNSGNLAISNLQVQSGKIYQVIDQGFITGAKVFIDRSYTFTNIPSSQTGATLIQTANGDKNSSGLPWLSFDVNEPVTIYIAHDQRITTKPSWMDTFTNTGEVIQTTDTNYDVWSQEFPTGHVLLGGNRDSGGSASMYSIAIIGQGTLTADTTPPSTPAIQLAGADSSTQVAIGWSAATDNVAVTGYTLYRDNSPITTTSNMSYTDSNLSPSTTYSYFVVAHDAANNNSALSTAASVTTPASPDTTPPSTPTIESGIADSSSQTTISWSAATDNVGVTEYTLYRDSNPLTTTPTLSFVDTNLSPTTTYAYFVVAHDAAGNNSGSSSIVSVTTLAPPDTTLPTVSISTPASGATVTGIILIAATAADNVGVEGVQFQLNGVNLGNEDTDGEYSISWDTSSILSGSFSLAAIARDAAGNTSTSSPVLITIDSTGINNSGNLEITNLDVQSGNPYIVIDKGLKAGETVYIDRAYTFNTIPSLLTGATYLQTANNDKNSKTDVLLSFDVNKAVTVYVSHDHRISTKPSWLNNFTNTGEVIQTSDTTLELWSQAFSAGQIQLGGNRGSTGGASMYSVAIVDHDSPTADTTSPSTPNIQSAVANSPTQATITWLAATDNVGVTGYSLYRDNNLLTTLSNLTYVDTSLAPVTTYQYSVVAHDGENNVSFPSPGVMVTTLPDSSSEPPGAPTIQNIQVDSDSQITLNWIPASVGNLAGLDPSVNLGAQAYCPAMEQPATTQPIINIASGDINDLLSKISSAQSGTTLLLADGVYTLQSNQSLEINTPGLSIRSATGNREAVRIEGGYNNISVNVDEFTVADLTLSQPTYHNIQVRGEKGVDGTKIYNLHMVDAGQQFVKISAGDGTLGKFADNGLVACSRIEYTTFSKGTDVSLPSYTNGVDLLAGKGWVIRDNEFRRIRSEAGPAGPTILAWKNSIDTHIYRNLIVDSWRGISLGLSTPNTLSRGGGNVLTDHQNGIVENNVILALNEPADAAIENNYALNSHIRNNTVYYNEALSHSVNWSIEYRFEPTTVTITNNLTNFPIIVRSPLPAQEGVLVGNITDAQANWFNDIMGENYHLVQSSNGGEATSFTVYRDDFPVGTTANWSYADSNLKPSSAYFYTVTALDAWGNESVPSAPVSGTTLAPKDTTPPQISITAPSESDIVSGIVTVSAVADDNIGVVGVQFQLDGINLGPEDSTNAYSATWDTTTLTPGTYRLTASARDAAGNAATSNAVTVSIEPVSVPSELEITNLTTESGKTYAVIPNGLISGAKPYTDRSYTFTALPTGLIEATYIQTANNDKNSSGSSFLSFHVNQPVKVYIAHDHRIATDPSWLGNFSNTGEVIQTSDATFEVWSQSFPSGDIVLGGNRGSSEGASMYMVVIVPDVGLGGGTNQTPPPQGTATLLWQKNTESDLSHYKVYYGTSSQVFDKSINVGLTASPDSPSYIITGLPVGTYYFTIRAVDTFGNESPPAPEKSKTITS